MPSASAGRGSPPAGPPPRTPARPGPVPHRTRTAAPGRGTSPAGRRRPGTPSRRGRQRLTPVRPVGGGQLQARPAEHDVGADSHPHVVGVDRLAPGQPGVAVGPDDFERGYAWHRVGHPALHSVLVHRDEAGFPSPNSVSSSRFVPITRSTPGGGAAATAASGWSAGGPRRRGQEGQREHPGSGLLLPISAVAATSRSRESSRGSVVTRRHPEHRDQTLRRRSASSTVWTCTPPLCTMARRKRPVAAGEPSNVATLKPPADSPKTVTLSGSPPKAAMFSRTQPNAATWSRCPNCRPGRPDRRARGARGIRARRGGS